jgi:hypothetical protein
MDSNYNLEGQTETELPVWFSSEINGPDGAHFTLYREEEHSTADIKEAKYWLRNNRDCLTITIEKASW